MQTSQELKFDIGRFPALSENILLKKFMDMAPNNSNIETAQKQVDFIQQDCPHDGGEEYGKVDGILVGNKKCGICGFPVKTGLDWMELPN